MLKKLQKISKERFINKNLEFLLSKLSLDIKSLSLETGIPIATIFRMKKDNNNPTLSSLEPLSEFFRVDLHDLLYEDLSSDEYQNKKKIGKTTYLPVINLEDINAWPIQFDSKLYFGAIGHFGEGSFGIAINTNSMSPVFYQNSIVIIDTEMKPKDTDYVFCLLEKNSVPVLRQLFIDGNVYYFKPVNVYSNEMVCTANYKILGIIVKSIENYR